MTTPANPNAVFSRRHDLDWLRIIAFGLLIFYHIGMFYVGWDWHVKSPYSNAGPEFAMMLLNPWRLSLLFFISGVAVRYLIDKRGAAVFATDRIWRLLPPILFGMIVVVMPQTYFELLARGAIEPGLLGFWPQYLTSLQIDGIIVPTWNHLWYVVYLLVYCLLIIPFLPLIRGIGNGPVGRRISSLWTGRRGPVALLFLIPVPFMIYGFLLDPQFETTHNLFWDWANHAHRFTMFLIGFQAAKSERFWQAVDHALPLALGYIIVFLPVFYVATEGSPPGWAGRDTVEWALRMARIVYAWAAILALMALARRVLNGDGPIRRYLTEAIFPFYILHQTLIIVAGVHLGRMELGIWTEFGLLTAITIGGCIAGYEIAKRIPLLRPVMGLKWRRK